MKELREIEKEMKRGECVSLEEVLKKHGVRKHAKAPRTSKTNV